jgi:hypothetical protein
VRGARGDAKTNAQGESVVADTRCWYHVLCPKQEVVCPCGRQTHREAQIGEIIQERSLANREHRLLKMRQAQGLLEGGVDICKVLESL